MDCARADVFYEMLSHFVVDFLTRPSRPLYPFSTREVDLKLYPRGLREMIIWDAILTVCLGLIYIMIPQSNGD